VRSAENPAQNRADKTYWLTAGLPGAGLQPKRIADTTRRQAKLQPHRINGGYFLRYALRWR